MRHLLLLFLAFLGLVTPTPTPTITPIPTSTPEVKAQKTVTYQGAQFSYSYFTVQNSADLSLIPNFSHPKDAESLMSENNCITGINGGFYDKSNNPLGFFQSSKKILGPRIESDLLNGFVWADASGSAVISSELPHSTFNFALQTGPMLLFAGTKQSLEINNDTHARRMVAAKNDTLTFITIYNENSVYEGPLLTDLPAIVEEIGAKEKLNIMDAINLDGGSASAFYSSNTKLSELTPVGSLFCLQ